MAAWEKLVPIFFFSPVDFFTCKPKIIIDVVWQ